MLDAALADRREAMSGTPGRLPSDARAHGLRDDFALVE
jgi:hypothetical protein